MPAKLNPNPRKEQLLAKLRASTTGIDVEYANARGQRSRRIYLDSTASTLQLGVARRVLEKYLPHYANTHTNAHFGAKLSTCEYEWAHDMVLKFVGADPKTHACFFVGSGTTGGINRVARTLARKFPDRDVVITSVMEHHSNDLPHRKNFSEVVHVPVQCCETGSGCADLDGVAAALAKYSGRVNYVAITGVSNVTGIVNPIYEIAELAHRHGALVLVDAAQMAAHVPIKMGGNANPERDLDIVCLSGHKIYAPGSPGAVIIRPELFAGVEPDEVGGGMVDDVHLDRYAPTEKFPDREEAGTPNIGGAIALASVLYALHEIGMAYIYAHETALINAAVERISGVPDVVVYGETDPQRCQRAGAISFNVRGMHHALTAAILNDYFNIAVRNACFCAHPYVRQMISEDLETQMDGLSNRELQELADLQRGMVRASFGLYNEPKDVDALLHALTEIVNNKADYAAQYQKDASGDDFVHKQFRFDSSEVFSARDEVQRWLEAG